MSGTSEGWRRWAGVLRDRSKVALTRSPALYRLARRPYAAARYALRRPHDPDYGAFALFPDRRGLFLDVGANAGMSALSFRVFRRELWDELRPLIGPETLAPSIFLVVGAAVRGRRIVEVPVTHLPRSGGTSTLRAWRLVSFSLRGLRQLLAFRRELRRSLPVPGRTVGEPR